MPNGIGTAKLVNIDNTSEVYVDSGSTFPDSKSITSLKDDVKIEFFTFNEKIGGIFFGNKGTRLQWLGGVQPTGGFWGVINNVRGRIIAQTIDVTDIENPYGIPAVYGFTAFNKITGEKWEFDGVQWLLSVDNTVEEASLGEVEQGLIGHKYVSPRKLKQNANILYRDGTRNMGSGYSPSSNQAITTKKYVDDKDFLHTGNDGKVYGDFEVVTRSGATDPVKVTFDGRDYNIKNLPTTAPTAANQLWNDGGILKIS